MEKQTKLPALQIRLYLTKTAENLDRQHLKTVEEREEYEAALTVYNTLGEIHNKKRTAAVKTCMEKMDCIKSELNECRLLCRELGVDFETLIHLNDVNNEIRGYHD